MVVQREVKEPPGLGELPGEAAVWRRWSSVARPVIVHDDDPARGFGDGGAKHFSGMH